MSESAKAVFLSYARDDAAAARRIAEALRASGLEVWFDENELRGGDQWDAKIRQQIDACALFVPLISAHTQERSKGYFRLEWKLAVDQTHLLAAGVPFIAPVVIDDTTESAAVVPPEFMRVQWSRLPDALPTPQFVGQVKRLLSGNAMEAGRPRPAVAGVGDPGPASARPATTKALPGWTWGALTAVVIGVALSVSRKPEPAAAPIPAPSSLLLAPVVAPAADAKSIAVLPFANLSTDKENEFFADGVHDDVITNLAKIRDLKVISRTSVLAYRELASRNLKKIAEELRVAVVLEGSVRRAGNKVRVTAQLIDARTDEHLWAETYDGDTSDIFALQAKLAQQIAAALKATLAPGERSLIERRLTGNEEAYELYLRARAMHQEQGEQGTSVDFERVIAVYEQAIALDPSFALAHTQVAQVHSTMYWFGNLDPTPARAEKMKAAVDAAVRLAPDAPETHLALGAYYYRVPRDWNRAMTEFRLAETGLPNDAQLLFWLAITHRRLGRWTESVGYFERGVALNPRTLAPVTNYTQFLLALRRAEQGLTAAARFLRYFPADRQLLDSQGTAKFALMGDRAAFAHTIEALPRQPTDPLGLGDQYRAAMIRGDYAAAEQVLADPRQTARSEIEANVITEPVALFRAHLAFVRGEPEAAARFADQAIAYYRGGTWNARQVPWVNMRVAQAEAWAGRFDLAVRDARAAFAEMSAQDAFDAEQFRKYLGVVYLAAGQREEALACLREMMTRPCSLSPHHIRIDPFWSRLKDDPRFEEILKSAKPL